MADRWNQPIKAKTQVDLYWQVVDNFRKSPVFSMFSDQAIRGFAEVAVDGLPVEEDNVQQ